MKTVNVWSLRENNLKEINITRVFFRNQIKFFFSFKKFLYLSLFNYFYRLYEVSIYKNKTNQKNSHKYKINNNYFNIIIIFLCVSLEIKRNVRTHTHAYFYFYWNREKRIRFMRAHTFWISDAYIATIMQSRTMLSFFFW